jgi:hypothetical protein
MTDVPHVAILTVTFFLCGFYWDVVVLGIFNGILPSFDIPLSPWCHNRQLWVESKESQLKPHLAIVAYKIIMLDVTMPTRNASNARN